MSETLVTIVTPAYNAERYLQDTLQSVLSQTYSRIEHLVIDDGSTDNTLPILKSYENAYNKKGYSLRYFSKPNEGQAITVNRGFELADGEVVVWLNADDTLFDIYVIEDVVRKFSANPAIDVIYGHMAIIDESNKLIKIQCAPPTLSYDMLTRCHPAACIFYRKSIIKKYKLNVSLNYALDYEQCLRMCRDGVRFGFLDRVLIGWRRHKSSKSVAKKIDARLEAIKVRNHYCQKTGASHYFKKFCVDYPYLYTFKLLGVRNLIRTYKQRERLAFNANFDSLTRLVFRQMVPFLT